MQDLYQERCDKPSTMRRKHCLCGLLDAIIQEEAVSTTRSAPIPFPSSASPASCINGRAGIFPCRNMHLLANLDALELNKLRNNRQWNRTDDVRVNDVWGYAARDGKTELAMIGTYHGTTVVSLTNYTVLGILPNINNFTRSSLWRDIKVYQKYALVVSEAKQHGLVVLDLERVLREDEGVPIRLRADAVWGNFSAHNIHVHSHYAYVVGSEEHCADGIFVLDVQNPLAPIPAGCYAQDGYTHDVQCVFYQGDDVRYRHREICLAYVTRVGEFSNLTPLL